MHAALSTLVERLAEPVIAKTGVIRWSCPVPAFGDLLKSKVATLGLNPSNREFVDGSGLELDGTYRRFHTLKSLSIDCWSKATELHLQLIADSCRTYFSRNPYDTWFRKLDYIISGTKTSFYDTSSTACHLDLIPYATACKWTELSYQQRSSLLTLTSDTLGNLLRDSPVRLLVLNGNSVVSHFQEITGVELEKKSMPEWSLPRRADNVKGFAYKGTVRNISGIALQNEILVLGFNHNIQSSFGVTKAVTAAIKQWVTDMVEESL